MGLRRRRLKTVPMGRSFWFLFPGLMVAADEGPGSRKRIFDRVDIFWELPSQVLKRGDPCRAALIRLQASNRRPNSLPITHTAARPWGRPGMPAAPGTRQW